MSYDYARFLQAVRLQRRTAPTGCWVCDLLDTSKAARARCWRVSQAVVDAHHVIPKQLLKREFPQGTVMFDGRWQGRERMEEHVVEEGRALYRARSLDDLLMDARNGILVRRYHHDALEHKTLAIPVRLLPEETIEFASELGLGWYLDKMDERRT